MREYNIRLEEPEDWQEVENLTREAFWNVYRPGCLEHFVLNRYRSNPDFIPELDFVMKSGGRIIGHVMYSKAELTSEDGDVLPAWTLGPISIHPDWKREASVCFARVRCACIRGSARRASHGPAFYYGGVKQVRGR